MKLSHAVFFFLAGIFGVWVGAQFFGLFWDTLISDRFEVGDMATWVAAFGTLFTLGFLINQHKQLHDEQKKEKIDRKRESSQQQNALREERKKRESHERQQKEMWAEQNQMFTFQKYKEHKNLFYDMLNELEREYNIKFFDRSGFYSSIFQSNNFNFCDITVDLVDSEMSPGSLSDINYLFNMINNSLHNATFYNPSKRQEHLESHLFSLVRFSGLLHITFRDVCYLGDIYWDVDEIEEPLVLNLFDSLKTTIVMQNVFFELLKFTGNEKPESINHMRTSFYQDAIIELVYKKYYRSSFSAHLKGLENALNLIFVTSDIIQTEKYRVHQQLWDHHNNIVMFLYNPRNKNISLTNPDALIDILEKQVSAFILFHKEKEGVDQPFADLLFSTEAMIQYLSKKIGVLPETVI